MFKDKTSFTSRLLGRKGALQIAGMVVAKGEAGFSCLSGSVDELFKSACNHPNVLRHADVSQH